VLRWQLISRQSPDGGERAGCVNPLGFDNMADLSNRDDEGKDTKAAGEARQSLEALIHLQLSPRDS